jgi:signal peptidase II
MPAGSRPGWHPLAFLVLAVLAADQLSKYAVERFSPANSFCVLIPGFLNLVHASNPGVAFGLLADSVAPWVPFLLILFSVSVIVLLVWLLVSGHAGGWFGQCGLALILGGALGNLLDRVLRHSVTDFIDFHIGSYHWYTFNIADSGIVVGATLVMIELFIEGRHPRRSAPDLG